MMKLFNLISKLFRFFDKKNKKVKILVRGYYSNTYEKIIKALKTFKEKMSEIEKDVVFILIDKKKYYYFI